MPASQVLCRVEEEGRKRHKVEKWTSLGEKESESRCNKATKKGSLYRGASSSSSGGWLEVSRLSLALVLLWPFNKLIYTFQVLCREHNSRQRRGEGRKEGEQHNNIFIILWPHKRFIFLRLAKLALFTFIFRFPTGRVRGRQRTRQEDTPRCSLEQH